QERVKLLLDGCGLLVKLADAVADVAQRLQLGLARLAAPPDPLAGPVLLGPQVVALVDQGPAARIELEHRIHLARVFVPAPKRLADNIWVRSDQRQGEHRAPPALLDGPPYLTISCTSDQCYSIVRSCGK